MMVGGFTGRQRGGFEQEGRCGRDDCQWTSWERGVVRWALCLSDLRHCLLCPPLPYRYSRSFHSHAGWWRVASWLPWSPVSLQGCEGNWTHVQSTCISSMTVCCCLGPESQWLEWEDRAQEENGRGKRGGQKGTERNPRGILKEPFSVA